MYRLPLILRHWPPWMKLAHQQRQTRMRPAKNGGHRTAPIHSARQYLSLVRHSDRDHFVAVPAINSEISIQGEHLGCAVDLRQSNETRIRQ